MILRSSTGARNKRSPGLIVEMRSRTSSLQPRQKWPSSQRSPLPSGELPLSHHESPQRSKKQKLQASFTNISPFPDHPHPTPTEAIEIHQLLNSIHHPDAPLMRRPPQVTSNSAQTCGNVPNVIEAVIGTILSQNTSGANCTRAKRGLDEAFGRNNFEAIANARKDEVIKAIRTGGLANKKARMIQGLLCTVRARHGVYSLQHLAGEHRSATDEPVNMRDEEIMEELLSYDGVGPKTASCVLLFCLGRDSFAVDTHIYRLSRLLGWIPAKADRVLAQAHLDICIPADLKYGLHVLMIQHGRACRGCKKPGSREYCVLKDYLKQKRVTSEEDAVSRLKDSSEIEDVKEGKIEE